MSVSGRYLTFLSWSTNLVPGDTNGAADVFLRDRKAGTIERVSLGSAGQQGTAGAGASAASADGRYVAFESWAPNLVPGDTNNAYDVFVRDRSTGTTTLVSASTAGLPANGSSDLNGFFPSRISSDGRYVIFESDATDLAADQTSSHIEVYVRDLMTKSAKMVSVTSSGKPANGDSYAGAISGDGKWVVFTSVGKNLLGGLTTLYPQLFLHDMATGETRLISKANDGTPADGTSEGATFSSDDRYVVFESVAKDLGPGGSNGDVWRLDRTTGGLTLVSVASDGTRGNYPSDGGEISADGRYVLFTTNATNLIPGDANGDTTDVLLRDLQNGTTTLENVSNAGVQANGDSAACGISRNGSLIMFNSAGDNLIKNDTNRMVDIFLRGPLT
jgi:dipeptidyl aminopeptidase/acylaminoacyl peptidase